MPFPSKHMAQFRVKNEPSEGYRCISVRRIHESGKGRRNKMAQVKIRNSMFHFISVVNQLNAQNLFHSKFYFMPLHVSSTMCSSSGSQKLHYTASGIITPIGGRLVHENCITNPDDEHMCSKHVQAWNKNLLWNKFCASSWLNTEINILICTARSAKRLNMVHVSWINNIFNRGVISTHYT